MFQHYVMASFQLRAQGCNQQLHRLPVIELPAKTGTNCRAACHGQISLIFKHSSYSWSSYTWQKQGPANTLVSSCMPTLQQLQANCVGPLRCHEPLLTPAALVAMLQSRWNNKTYQQLPADTQQRLNEYQVTCLFVKSNSDA